VSELIDDCARASELRGSLHKVTLPGTSKPVLLRDIPVFEFAAGASLPLSLAAKLSGGSGAEPTEQDVRDYADWVKCAVSMVFVQPRCAPPAQWGTALAANGDLLDPTLLPAQAQRWLVRFAKGEIDAAGRPVGRFREEGEPADGGDDRENVSRTAEPTA
jgi:hypothetical protein